MVRPVDDLLVDRRGGDRLSAGAAVDQQLQLVLLVEPLDLPWRVVQVVPHPGLEAVAVIDDRALPGHLFQAVGIQLGLLLAVGGADSRPLGFQQRQRKFVPAPHHVVHEAFAAFIRHADDRILARVCPVWVPFGFTQHHVDEQAAGRRLAVVGFWHSLLIRGPQFGNLPPQPIDFLLRAPQHGFACGQRLVPCGQLLLQLLELLGRPVGGRCRGGTRDQPIVKRADGGRRGAVHADGPAQKRMQHAGHLHAVMRVDRRIAVDSQVANLVDQPDLVEQARRQDVAKRRFVDQRGEVVLIRLAQVAVAVVQPLDHPLHGPPSVERAGARRGKDVLLRLPSVVAQRRPVGEQEVEVGGHGAVPGRYVSSGNMIFPGRTSR